jgi:release factor glutamine methyltransferase
LAKEVPCSPLPVTSPPFIIDVGTGTGAIILSLAKEYKGEAVFLGTDVSEDAIALAKENAGRCGLKDRVKFAVMDGLDDFDEPGMVDVLVSNPPYIESAVCETLDPRVKDFEPRLALDGGVSGLDFYDRYLGDALNILKPGGAVFFEIGENQGEAVAKLMADYGFDNIRIERDFAGHDRYASATLA